MDFDGIKERIANRELNIGWIGAGVMGRPMCGHLMEAGFPMTIYTRTPSKAKPLTDLGARFAVTARELAKQTDLIITMVGFPEDVESVYFGDKGVFKGLGAAKILIDMTTTKPALAREIAARAQAKGCHALDVPVSGGDVGARKGALSMMVGGDEQAFRAVAPLLAHFGEKIVYQGGAGSGQHTKMCNQIVIAGTMIGVCESLLYGYKAGLDMHVVLQSIASGAAGCWTLDNLAPRMLERNFDPGFFVEHFVKDMGIALEESKRMGLELAGLDLALSLYRRTVELGYGKMGTHALLLALETIAQAD